MSETEKGKIAMLPPVGEFVPTEAGVAAWVARSKTVEVVPLPHDARVLRIRDGQVEIEFQLEAKCAAHLARLLASKTEAA